MSLWDKLPREYVEIEGEDIGSNIFRGLLFAGAIYAVVFLAALAIWALVTHFFGWL